MNFDFSKIQVQSRQPKPIHPIDIFQASAVTDDNINDLWLAQGDALREWNTHRTLDDVAVALNTGAGKTLVGLLIAQSLVNETHRQVVYACSSIQLVEQTADKARGYGLPVTTYFRGQFSSDNSYHRAEAPCVTTYQALCNGKTRFRADDIAAAIFDDAHTAEHILRGQFSLCIDRERMAETYEQVMTLFKPYHHSVGLATSYAEVWGEKSSRQFLVPPFEVRTNVEELRRILLEANLSELPNTMFSWEHIRDHEELCCLLISDQDVTLTPPIVPVSTLPYFAEGVRRVYLSATLSAPDSFVRAFGRQPNRLVAPSTTAGECERMILIPSAVQAADDDIASAKEIIKDKKALILVPSFARGNEWANIGAPPRRDSVPQSVDSFRNAAPPEKLTLAARYDGIDLPGDTCRVMVLDELPTGSGPLERFQWERLNMQNSLHSMLASRIVQSFGRISRGLSDHGIVLITGKGLVDWLLVPRNRSLLPEFLQKQIKIGENLSKGASNTDGLKAAVTGCLSRAPEWIDFYKTNMLGDSPVKVDSIDLEKALTVALAEASFGNALWERDFQRAANVLNCVLPDAFDFSQYTGAWLSLWLGFTLEMNGDSDAAFDFYKKSHATQPNLPRPTTNLQATPTPVPDQVARVAEQMQMGHSNSVRIPKTILQDLTALNGNGSAPQTEEALRCLGQYLGLKSLRPDNEFGAGPDVLWLEEGGHAVCMEVKSDKGKTSSYRKEDVGQLHNHVQWVKDNFGASEINPAFVGPLLTASNSASPSPDMRVVELRQFEELGKKLVSALQDAPRQAMPLTLRNDLHQVMQNRGLLYPDVFLSLDLRGL